MYEGGSNHISQEKLVLITLKLEEYAKDLKAAQGGNDKEGSENKSNQKNKIKTPD